MPRRTDRPGSDATPQLDALLFAFGIHRLSRLCRQLHQRVRRLKSEKIQLQLQLDAALGELEFLRSVARDNGFNVVG